MPRGWRRVVGWVLLSLIAGGIILAPLVGSAASGAWWAVLALGIWWGWPAWRTLAVWERIWVVALLAMPVTASLSLLTSEDVRDSLSELEKYARFAGAAGVYLTLRSWRLPLQPVLLITVSCAVVAYFLYGAYQHWVLDLPRAGIGAVWYITYGDLAMAVTLLVAAGVFAWCRRWWQWSWGLLIGLGLLAVVLSKTRNAFLVVPTLMVVLPILIGKRLRWWGYIAGYAGIGACVVIAWFAFPQVSDHFQRGLQDIREWSHGESWGHRTSLGSRLTMWQYCLELWPGSPVIGIGLGDYGVEMERLLRDHPEHHSFPFLYQHHAHSLYIHSLTMTGIVGFVNLMLVLWIPGIIGWFARRRAVLRRELWPGLAAMGITLCFAVFGIGEAIITTNTFISAWLLLLVPITTVAAERVWPLHGVASEAAMATESSGGTEQDTAPSSDPDSAVETEELPSEARP